MNEMRTPLVITAVLLITQLCNGCAPGLQNVAPKFTAELDCFDADPELLKCLKQTDVVIIDRKDEFKYCDPVPGYPHVAGCFAPVRNRIYLIKQEGDLRAVYLHEMSHRHRMCTDWFPAVYQHDDAFKEVLSKARERCGLK